MTPPRSAPTGRRTRGGPVQPPLPGPRPSRAPTVLPDRRTGRRAASLASRPPPLTATPMLGLVPPTSDAWTSRGDRDGTRPAHAANADANTCCGATGAPPASPSGRCADARSAPGRWLADLAELASVSMCHLRGIRGRRRDVTPDTSRPALRRSSCLRAWPLLSLSGWCSSHRRFEGHQALVPSSRFTRVARGRATATCPCQWEPKSAPGSGSEKCAGVGSVSGSGGGS
jgi:hypothetical protein